MKNNIEKKLFLFQIIRSELAALMALLRRENLWAAVNVFTNSSKILRITEGDFFEFNCVHSDQQIW